jgi:hypothetical protein
LHYDDYNGYDDSIKNKLNFRDVPIKILSRLYIFDDYIGGVPLEQIAFWFIFINLCLSGGIG